MTVKETFNKFISGKKLADLSEKSIYAYESFISPFVSYIGQDTDIEDVTQDKIEAYILLIVERSLSRATKATYIRNIRIFLHWAEQRYPVKFESCKIRVPKSPKRNVKIYSAEDMRLIFESVHTESEWMDRRNRLIIALMYDSGLRLSEVCSLRREWVSVELSRMKVRGKGDKERLVPIGTMSKRYLALYYEICPYSSEYVFLSRRGNPLTCNAVKNFFCKLSDGLPFDVSAHKLRHNFATNYCLDSYEVNGQVDIFRLQVLMGHESIDTTKRYLHFANEIMASSSCISHLDRIAET